MSGTNKPIRFRRRAHRYGFTINNPFITDDITVLDPDNLTAGQRELLGKVTHDYSVLKRQEYEQYFNFALAEYDQKEDNRVIGKIVAERAFFKDYKAAQEYFKAIGFIDYFCFQYERGKSGNLHLQGFMHFSRPTDFEVVRAIFPTMHLDKCDGKNSECRTYCIKEAAKIEGYDFYEHGVLVEERQRTDIEAIKEGILNKRPTLEMFKEYPGTILNSINRIKILQQEVNKAEFRNKVRDMRVTYIYGADDADMSMFPDSVLGCAPIEIYTIEEDNYGRGRFDEYEDQDVIIFNSFYGQIPVTLMNGLLDGRPRYLPARYSNKVACYTKAFIISAYPPERQYERERKYGYERSVQSFLSKIHEIICMPERDVYIWEKGKPTEEIKQTLERQGAKYIINE